MKWIHEHEVDFILMQLIRALKGKNSPHKFELKTIMTVLVRKSHTHTMHIAMFVKYMISPLNYGDSVFFLTFCQLCNLYT